MITNQFLIDKLGFMYNDTFSLFTDSQPKKPLHWLCNCGNHNRIKVERHGKYLYVKSRSFTREVIAQYDLTGKSMLEVVLFFRTVQRLGNAITHNLTAICAIEFAAKGMYLLNGKLVNGKNEPYE